MNNAGLPLGGGLKYQQANKSDDDSDEDDEYEFEWVAEGEGRGRLLKRKRRRKNKRQNDEDLMQHLFLQMSQRILPPSQASPESVDVHYSSFDSGYNNQQSNDVTQQLNQEVAVGYSTQGEERIKRLRSSDQPSPINQNIVTHFQPLSSEVVVSRSVWNTDTHLYIRNKISGAIRLFSDIVTFTIHPAILDESNWTWLVESEDAIIYPSPLALNLSMAICIGAHALGDKLMEEEFFHRSKDVAGELFDQTDFHVASGLMMLGYYCCWNIKQPETGAYYSVIGQTICEQLRMINNPVYTRLLAQLYLSATASPQNFRTYFNKINRMRAEPHSHDRALMRRPGGQHDESFDTQVHGLDEGLDMLLQSIVVDLTVILSQIAATPDNSELVRQSVTYLRFLQDKWDQVKHAFKPSQILTFDLVLSSISTRIAQLTSDYEGAVRSSLRFLEMTSHPLFCYLPLAESIAAPILKTLSQVMNQDGDAQHFLRLVSVLLTLHSGTFFKGPLRPYLNEANQQMLNAGNESGEFDYCNKIV